MKTDQLLNAITGMLPNIPGWCDLDKAHAMAAAVVALRPTVCVEVGVFGGRSLLPVAMALEAVGHGVVHAIDPWSAAAATEGYDGKNKEWWGSLNLDQIHQRFVSDVGRLGLSHRVVVQRSKSDDATAPDVIDFAHLDGQHTDQAVRDVNRFASRVRIGGLCCLDDIDWVNESTGCGVKRAADRLLQLGFSHLYPLGTGAMFQRTRR